MRTSAENTNLQNANIVEQINVSTNDAPRRARRPGEAVGNKKIREEKEKMAASILGEPLIKELSELLADTPKLKDDVLEAVKKTGNQNGSLLQILNDNDLGIFPALINAEHPEKFPTLNRAKEEFLTRLGKPVGAISDTELCLDLLEKTLKKILESELHPITINLLRSLTAQLDKAKNFTSQQRLNSDNKYLDELLKLRQETYKAYLLSRTVQSESDHHVVNLKHAITEIMPDKGNFFGDNLKEKTALHHRFSRVLEKLEGQILKLLNKEIVDPTHIKKAEKINRTQKMYQDFWIGLTTTRTEFYLEDLSNAITMLENENNVITEEKTDEAKKAKEALVSKLKALKETLYERVEKQLNKVSRADLKELESARKIASEHLKMVNVLCDPEANDVKKEFAISDCFDNCVKEPLGITILKILGVIAFAAIGAVVGSVVGALILHGVGGFPGAFVGAYTGAAWAATTIGVTATGASLGLGASAVGFFSPNTLKRRLYDVKKEALNAIIPPPQKIRLKEESTKTETDHPITEHESLLGTVITPIR